MKMTYRNEVFIFLLLGSIIGLRPILSTLLYPDYTIFSFQHNADNALIAIHEHYFSLTNSFISINNFQILPVAFFGTLNKFMPIDYVFLISPFIFIPVLAYVIFKFCLSIGIEKKISILGTVSMISLPSLVWMTPTVHIGNLINAYTIDGFNAFIIRYPNYLSLIIFFITLKATVDYLDNFRYSLMIGVATGILMYSYFYLSSFLMFLIAYLILRRGHALYTGLFVAIILIIPAIFIYFQLPADYKLSVYDSNTYDFVTTIKLMTVGVLVYKYSNVIIGEIIILTEVLGVFAANIIPQTTHYNHLIGIPFGILGFIMLFNEFLIKKYSKEKFIIPATYCIILFFVLMPNIISGYNNNYRFSDSVVDSDVKKLIYDNRTYDSYPPFFGGNTFQQEIDYLNISDVQNLDNLTKYYIFHGYTSKVNATGQR